MRVRVRAAVCRASRITSLHGSVLLSMYALIQASMRYHADPGNREKHGVREYVAFPPSSAHACECACVRGGVCEPRVWLSVGSLCMRRYSHSCATTPTRGTGKSTVIRLFTSFAHAPARSLTAFLSDVRMLLLALLHDCVWAFVGLCLFATWFAC